MLVIGVCGFKFSGKNTFADVLVKNFNFEVVEIASKLKRTCAEVFNLSHEFFHNPALKEANLAHPITVTTEHLVKIGSMFKADVSSAKFQQLLTRLLENEFSKPITTPRKLLQLIGTDFLRAIDSNIHLNNVEFTSDKVVVADVRFKNEAEFFCNLYKSPIVHIVRPSISLNSLHISELEIEKTAELAKYQIVNDGSLDDFISKSLDLGKSILKDYGKIK